MRINNNIMALNAHRQLGINRQKSAKAMEKLSSGLRINRAGDDAAGLAISEKMRSQIRGLKQAINNAQDGISLILTAEGALNETHAILQRMRELAVQAATDTNTDEDREEIQKEIDQLAEEISRIAENTEFNTRTLLDGNFEALFHIGANEGQNVTVRIESMDAAGLGLLDANGDLINVVDRADADSCIGIIDEAIAVVSGERSKLGATQNRLEHTIANLGASAENLQAAESRIRDLDMAEEVMEMTKNAILEQAATAMLAQANMAPQSVLQLLG